MVWLCAGTCARAARYTFCGTHYTRYTHTPAHHTRARYRWAQHIPPVAVSATFPPPHPTQEPRTCPLCLYSVCDVLFLRILLFCYSKLPFVCTFIFGGPTPPRSGTRTAHSAHCCYTYGQQWPAGTLLLSGLVVSPRQHTTLHILYRPPPPPCCLPHTPHHIRPPPRGPRTLPSLDDTMRHLL